MSELTNARTNGANFRWQLLATVSAIALIGAACGANEANAADDDSGHPLVWIELGGQLSRLEDRQEAFSPVIMAGRPSVFTSPQTLERPPLYSLDETGAVSFQPEGSDWQFSASVRYGRSKSRRVLHQKTNPPPAYLSYISPPGRFPSASPFLPKAAKFSDTSAENSENHLIVDFQAGRDVGLGMFGRKDSSSVLSLGVRFAQFSSRSNFALASDPNFHFTYKYIYNIKLPNHQVYRQNEASLIATRNFHGVGPSLSWKASEPVVGNGDNGKVSLDWGLNAAVLFGRQKAMVHRQGSVENNSIASGQHVYHSFIPPYATSFPRSRSVTVPNVGGFAGASFRIQSFKVSAGYRADLFFHAMDGGIDTRKSENVGFYGPFATISVGLGG